MKQFQNRLQDRMSAMQLAQDDLAKKLDVSPTSVWRWVQGTPPRDKMLARLAMALKVRPEWLRTGEPPQDLPVAMMRGVPVPPDVSSERNVLREESAGYHVTSESSMNSLPTALLWEIVEGGAEQVANQNMAPLRQVLAREIGIAARELKTRLGTQS